MTLGILGAVVVNGVLALGAAGTVLAGIRPLARARRGRLVAAVLLVVAIPACAAASPIAAIPVAIIITLVGFGVDLRSSRPRSERVAPRRGIRWLRRLGLAVLAVLVGASAAGDLYLVSVQPGAALVKAVFETGAEVTPPAGFAAIASRVQEQRNVVVHAAGAPAASVDIYSPKAPSSSALPVILWIHGGGFISSSADTVRDYAVLLAERGYVVVNLDYSLAPGARYPAPVLQGAAALDYIAGHASSFGGDPSRVFLGGDSAGAQISSELAAAETNPALATSLGVTPALQSGALRGVVLFCGLYDMRTVGATGFPALRTYLWAYTGDRDWTEFPGIDQLSTTRTATAAYPATFISVGDADPFRTQEAEFASVLRAKGVSVTSLTWSSTHHLGHEYQFDFTTSEATTAFSDTLQFLAKRSGTE